MGIPWLKKSILQNAICRESQLTFGWLRPPGSMPDPAVQPNPYLRMLLIIIIKQRAEFWWALQFKVVGLDGGLFRSQPPVPDGEIR